MTGRCTLICCAFDRERANRAPGRRSLTPLYSPAAATRDAVAGDSTPSTTTPGAPEPHLTSPGLGSTVVLGQTSSVTGEDGPVALDTHPRRSPFLSVRMRWWDDFLDDLIQAFGITTLALLALLVGFVIAVRVFGGAS